MAENIQAYCRAKGFHRQTEARWLALGRADGAALFAVVAELRAGENHVKDILDWLEEIALRDGVGVAAILDREELKRAATDPRLGRSDRLKRLKDELRRLRFPRLARVEDEIRRRIRELKPDPRLALGVPPGLEGGAVTIGCSAASCEELKRLAAELSRIAEEEKMREIFALLGGDASVE